MAALSGPGNLKPTTSGTKGNEAKGLERLKTLRATIKQNLMLTVIEKLKTLILVDENINAVNFRWCF